MEFGKVDSIEDLERINFTLPATDSLAPKFLKTLHDPKESIRLGAPAWAHKEWIGSLYPQGTKPADFLFHYSRAFETIELNTTHYRIPSLEQSKKWIAQVPSEFQFCAKVFKGISHTRLGLLDKLLLGEWFEFVASLGEHRGPCFIQFPPGFTYSEKAILFQFLKLWPDEIPLSLEFRHTSWFQNHCVLPALVEYLQTRKIGLVITDVAGRRDVLHTSISSDHCMIRFIGNGLHATDYLRADQWIKTIQDWQALGLPKPILFLHQPDDIKLPEISAYVRSKLDA